MNKFILVFIFIIFTGCTFLIGIKKQNQFDLVKVEKFINNNQINKYSNYYINKNYIYFIDSISRNTKERNYLLQPLQILYYKNGNLVSYHVNCNAGGFPNLNWNRDNNFNYFPPISQTQIKSYLYKFDILRHSSSILSEPKMGKNMVIIFWSLMLEKQSKKMIRLVFENLKLNKNESYELVFINSDKLYIN